MHRILGRKSKMIPEYLTGADEVLSDTRPDTVILAKTVSSDCTTTNTICIPVSSNVIPDCNDSILYPSSLDNFNSLSISSDPSSSSCNSSVSSPSNPTTTSSSLSTSTSNASISDHNVNAPTSENDIRLHPNPTLASTSSSQNQKEIAVRE